MALIIIIILAWVCFGQTRGLSLLALWNFYSVFHRIGRELSHFRVDALRRRPIECRHLFCVERRPAAATVLCTVIALHTALKPGCSEEYLCYFGRPQLVVRVFVVLPHNL